jgi:hypothetical protein
MEGEERKFISLIDRLHDTAFVEQLIVIQLADFCVMA